MHYTNEHPVTQKGKTNHKRFHRILAAAFICFLFVFIFLFLVIPDSSFSENENRSLTTLPSPSLGELEDGRFEKNFTDYVSDQFPFRTLFVSLKTLTDRLLGQDSENGIYAGKNGCLIEKASVPDSENESRLVDAISSFQKKHADTPQYFLLAPNAVSILSSCLPNDAPCADQNLYIDDFISKMHAVGVTASDVRGILTENKSSYIYYKTDHHWTTKGAYLAFEALSDVMGLDASAVSYDFLPVSTNFCGTLAKKSGLYTGETDTIEIGVPKDGDLKTPDYIVEYVEEKEKTTVFYAADKLKTKDQYGMFLDGNHAEIRIRTTSASPKRLMILKDSYANCLIPFLAPYFREILVIDPRYCYEDVETLFQSEGIDEVLYLYNANTLFEDTDLTSYLNAS